MEHIPIQPLQINCTHSITSLSSTITFSTHSPSLGFKQRPSSFEPSQFDACKKNRAEDPDMVMPTTDLKHTQSKPPDFDVNLRLNLNTYKTIIPHLFPFPISSNFPSSVRIVEVGPRDGLQNESQTVDSLVKIRLVHDLVAAGLQTVEVTAFVSPKWVPQLADASTVMSGIRQEHNVSYPVLVPNLRGLHNAIEAGAQEIAVFASATETFSQKNLNCSISQSLDRFRTVISIAISRGFKVRGYVSCVVGCPYEGKVDPIAVANVAFALFEMGCYEISLGDTIGVGNPKSITEMLQAVLKRGIPVENLAIHCHDTRGMALANVVAAMALGVAVVDSSVAGLGGCPYAPGAPGNLPTEDLVYMLQEMDIDIGDVSLPKLLNIGHRICEKLQRKTRSRIALAINEDRDPTTVQHLQSE